jgi:hypothetical protein
MFEPGQFRQHALRCTDPVQYDYEVIRDIMLTDATVAERSRATGLDREMVGEKARRFLEGGMPSIGSSWKSRTCRLHSSRGLIVFCS